MAIKASRVEYSFCVDFPGVPPSLNVFLTMHWVDRIKVKRVWSQVAYLFSFEERRQLKRWAEEETPMHVVITLHHSRFYDRDNCFGGASKIILDELRHAELLHNDGIKKDGSAQVYCEVFQQKAPRNTPHTTIEIWKA